ncbi:uncharacterized protein ISCGN_026937 [Ixodes scapularis]
MDQGKLPAALRPSILDPGGTSLVNMEPETTDTSLNLTSGMRGTETQAAATGTTATTAGPSTEGLQIVLDLNTLGKLNEFGVAREDIGRLFVSFLTYLATTQQGKGAQPTAAEKVSSCLGQEYPTIAQAAQLTKTPLKSQDAKPNGTEATLLAENIEDNSWTLVQNRRRRKRSLTSIEEPEKKAAAMSIDERPQSKTTRAIVLKPVCKEAVNGFRARDIRQAAETAGIESQEDFKFQYQTKTNTITLTTQEECTAEKLLRLKAIEKNGKQYTVCPYRAMAKNQIRDNHLLNLWASRLQALQRYRKNRTLDLKIKLKRAAAKARQYSKQLGSEWWRSHCGSFNARNGLGRAWRTYKGLNGGKRKTRNAAQNLALKLNISESEMAIRTAEFFFPQEDDSANQRPVAMNIRTPEEEGMEDPLNMGELIKAVYTAKTGSAPGPDGVTYQALRNLPEKSKQKLLDKYNTVWEEGILPRAWKLSWVTPIPKPGKLLDRIENMRPVSLTSNICKTMEKIVLRRIQWYLEKHERLDPRQTGIREAMGTQDSLRLLYEEVLAEKDKQDRRLVVALDIRKAFDSVPHWAVVREAKACGIRGRTLNFIRDFLRDGRFQVKIGGTMGPEAPIKRGVPQGAVLSPTLFNMILPLPYGDFKVSPAGVEQQFEDQLVASSSDASTTRLVQTHYL